MSIGMVCNTDEALPTTCSVSESSYPECKCLQSFTPIYAPVFSNHPKMLMLLLQHGSDPNRLSKEVSLLIPIASCATANIVACGASDQGMHSMAFS